MMWPSLATHYNKTIRIKTLQDETTFLEEFSMIRPEKLISIKSGLAVGNGPVRTSNLSMDRMLACRVWVKKYELKAYS